TPQADGSIVASGSNPATDEYVVQTHSDVAGATGFKIEALPEASFINGGPGRADNGNFVLGEIVVERDGKPLAIEPLMADFEQQGWSLRDVTDGKDNTGWAIMPAFGKPHEAIIAFTSSQETSGTLTFRLRFRSPHVQH